MHRLFLRCACLLGLMLCGDALEDDAMTATAFDAALNGRWSPVRVAFVKFHTASCGPCKDMEPAWRAVADEHRSSASFLIASVECSGSQPDAKRLCDAHNITTTPTLVYFMGGDPDGEHYEDDNSAEKLQAFARALATTCFPHQTEPCATQSADQLAYLASMGSASVRRDFRGMQKAKREKRAKMVRAFDEYERMARSTGDPSITAQAVDEARQTAIEAAQDVQRQDKDLSWYRQVKAYLTDKNTAMHVARDEAHLRMMEAQERASKEQQGLNDAFFKGMS